MLRLLLALATTTVVGHAAAHAAEWTVDAAHSTASFTVKHMMVSKVRGEFGKMSGTASWDKPDYSDGHVEITIDAASVDTRNAERDKHLRSADFFDVQKFPTLTFRSKRVAKGKAKRHLTVVGELTIHGVTKEVAFDVTAPTPERRTPYGTISVGLEARAKINRRDFGLSWNQALEAGGVLVSNEVDLEIDVELSRKGATSAELSSRPGQR